MERAEIQAKVKEKVCEKLRVPDNEYTETTTLQNGYGADSFDMVEIVMDFEYMFKIRISDLESERIQNSRDIVDLIEKKLKKDGK